MSSSSGPSRLEVPSSKDSAPPPRANGSSSGDIVSTKIDLKVPNNLVTFMRRLTDILDTATSRASTLPPKSDLSFHRTLDRKFAKNQDEAGDRILKLADQLLASVHGGLTTGKGKARRRLDDEDDVVDGYRRGVLDVVNGLLEDAATNLDNASGVTLVPVIDVAQSSRAPGIPPFRTTFPSLQSIPKPQDSFSGPYHSVLTPEIATFVPHLEVKHHAMIPFELVETTVDSDSSVEDGATESLFSLSKKPRRFQRTYQHPYRYEVDHLGYPTSMFTHAEPINPPGLSHRAAIWVDTPSAYEGMVQELLQAKEIAVDLEHHNIRSYYGFTCLIQISTREKDWIVDPIQLRDLISRDKFGGVFADPSVIKVLHGADSDVVWLQKDFQIYIVNLFDTHQAAKYLGYPRRSLKALVERHCSISLDKSSQMADWRVRPLSNKMLHYAQSDTHFLLYIYDKMRNELLDSSRLSDDKAGQDGEIATPNPQGAMRVVLEWSEGVGLQVYSREYADYHSGKGTFGWRKAAYSALGRGNVATEAGSVFIHLHCWRDKSAKADDESPHYIMSNGFLRGISVAAGQSAPRLRAYLDAVPNHLREQIMETVKIGQESWQKSGVEGLVRRITPEKADMSALGIERPMTHGTPRHASPTTARQDTEAQLRDNENSDEDLWGATEEPDLKAYMESFSTTRGPTSDLTGTAKSPFTGNSRSDLFGSLSTARTRTTHAPSDFLAVKSAIDRALAVPGGLSKDQGMAGHQATPDESFLHDVGGDAPVAKDDELQAATQAETSEVAELKENEEPRAAAIDEYVEASDDVDEETGESVVRVKGTGRRRKGSAAKDRKAKKAKKSKEDVSLDGGVDSFYLKHGVEDFDYSSVPSLLDAQPTTTRADKRKKQKGKGGQFSSETFGQAAKDPSQPKGGNKSMTFG